MGPFTLIGQLPPSLLLYIASLAQNMEDPDVPRVPWALSGIEAEQWWLLGLGGSPRWYRHWDADSDVDLESESGTVFADELVEFDPTAIDRPMQEEALPENDMGDLAPLHDSALLSPIREHFAPDPDADFQTPRKTLQFEPPGDRLESPTHSPTFCGHQDQQHGTRPDPTSAPSDWPSTDDCLTYSSPSEDVHMDPGELSGADQAPN